ncbi:MAG TPA: PepSY-associated TM helix domain-containing protein [Sphingomonadaceae bacterium]|nr:PepSY-associated TM helix domain-containing protein [Sphingomonadaceae bacterium]
MLPVTRNTVRAWYLVHKWTSIVCTAFLLMLCVTGLPLIFHEEIDELTSGHGAITADATTPLKSLDEMMRIALAKRPGEVGLFLSFDDEKPIIYVTTGPTPDAADAQMTTLSLDQRTGDVIGNTADGRGVMDFILQLHADMFLGLPGMLFLGFMGLLFVAAIISGVVLYAPFMRKLAFGTVRAARSRRVKWLDYHNLLGIVALAWASVVGLTGVINTLATPIIQLWQHEELAELTAAYKDQAAPAPGHLASIQAAVNTALAAVPDSRPQFVAFPGGSFSSKHHYAVFLQGDTPLTRTLLTPALVDAETGKLAAIKPMPWYAKALLLSQPLHFGDYGGLPLKILWALLDLFTIVILGSGLYLWLGKRRAPLDDRVREVESGGIAVPVAAE